MRKIAMYALNYDHRHLSSFLFFEIFTLLSILDVHAQR